MATPHEWGPTAPALDGAALLERAVSYTRTALQLVPGTDLDSRTPCAAWDLRTLLRHMDDALAALTEAAEVGYVDLRPVRAVPEGAELVHRLRDRACALLAAWAPDDLPDPVTVHDAPVRSDLLAAAGALEIAVHGWDVAQACGEDRPLPPLLALDLLDLVPALVDDSDREQRPPRFGAALVVPLHARPSDRLLAAVGRRG